MLLFEMKVTRDGPNFETHVMYLSVFNETRRRECTDFGGELDMLPAASLLFLPFDACWRIDTHTPSPSRLDLFSDLLHHFIHVPAGVFWETQELAVLHLDGAAAATATFGHKFHFLISISHF